MFGLKKRVIVITAILLNGCTSAGGRFPSWLTLGGKPPTQLNQSDTTTSRMDVALAPARLPAAVELPEPVNGRTAWQSRATEAFAPSTSGNVIFAQHDSSSCPPKN